MRRAGLLLTGFGIVLVGYAALVAWRGDPITAIYAHHEQHLLMHELTLQSRAAQNRRRLVPTPTIREGMPLGVLRIPSLGIHAVVVQGTASGDLAKGPGHYVMTAMPGSGRVVAIAGHRTTFGAWFRHLDDLRRGSAIDVSYRGRRFTYSVTGTRVVLPTDWSVLRFRGHEELVLSTCDPVYSASHRLIVFARLAAVSPA